jgi:hypothetical protein
MYDRLLFGMLEGEYGDVKRQVKARYSGKAGRIDFQVGPASTGTIVELAIGAKSNGNTTELHKLSRQHGGQRVLMLLNTSAKAVDIDALRVAFSQIKATRGRLPTRNDVRVVVCGQVTRRKKKHGLSDYSFVWRGTKSRDRN